MASRNQAIEKFNQGKYQTALNIAKKFKMGVTQDQRSQMALGYECMVHGDTYSQMGYNLEEEINHALNVLKNVLGINSKEEYTMAEINVINQAEETKVEEVKTEVAEPVWVLTARERKGAKAIHNFICKDGETTKDAVAALKDKGLTFLTLTTDIRIRSYLSGNPLKEWKSNENALKNKGYTDVLDIYQAVLDHLDCTTEEERWSIGNVVEVIKGEPMMRTGEEF